MYNILIWCLRLSQFLDFIFAIARFLFLAPFLSFFPGPFHSRYISFALHILSGCRKKLGFNYGQSLEMAPWLIIDIMCDFTPSFTPKLTTSVSLLHQNASDIFPLNKRLNTTIQRKNRIYFNNSIRSKIQRHYVGTQSYKCLKQTGNQRKPNLQMN